jgi:hypothetical protein
LRRGLRRHARTLDQTEWLPSWQWDLASWQNAVFGLMTTLACFWCAMPFGRTQVEIVSPRWDAEVVKTLRARFKRPDASSSSS